MDDQVDRYLQNVERSRLKGLREKSSEEHLLALIKAAFELVPGVGGAISTLIDEYYPDRQWERLISFVEDLARRLRWIEHQVKAERIPTEEFGHLFFDTLRSAYRDYQQEKLEAYRAILLNTLIAPDFIPDESELFLSLVRELAVHHIQMLRVLYQPQESISEDIRFESQDGQYVMSIRGVLHRVFAGAPEGFVDAIWTGLSARGLVHASSYEGTRKLSKSLPPGKMVDFTDDVFRQLPGCLTPFGGRFVQFITDPTQSIQTVEKGDGGLQD